MNRFVCLWAVLLGLMSPLWAAPVKVSGVVKGPGDKPVVGATVRVIEREGYNPRVRETTTGADGKFAFEIEPDADFRGEEGNFKAYALVEAPGFAFRGVLLGDKEASVKLVPGASVSGVVTDESGRPVEGARVQLRSTQEADDDYTSRVWFASFVEIKERFSTTTGAGGMWTLPGVPQGGMADVELSDPRFIRTSVSVAPGEAGAKLVTKPGATIAGRVLQEDGKPASGARVSARSQDQESQSYGSALAGKDGDYEITGLSGGKHLVSTQVISGERVAPQVEVVAKIGETARVPDIAFQTGLLAEGTVVEAGSKKGIAGAQVMAQGDFGSSQSSKTDAQGRYTVRVLPGEVSTYLFDPPKGFIRSEYAQRKTPIAPGNTTLPPITLQKGLSLEGTAVDENGKPVTGAEVGLGVQSWSGVSTTVDDKGHWTLEGISPNENDYDPNPRPRKSIALKARGDWEVVSGGAVSLPFNGNAVKLVLRRITLATLEARVLTPDGQPVGGAKVSYTLLLDVNDPRQSRTMGERTTDAQGRFRLPKLRPEQGVELKAEKAGYALVSGGQVEKKDGQFLASDMILSPLNARLAGRVTDEAGQPALGALVAPLESVDLRESDAKIITAQDGGRFALDGLPPTGALVGAAKGRAFGRMIAKPDAEAVVALAAPSAMPSGEGLWALADEWKKGRTERDYYGTITARQLVALDPDRARQWAAKDDGSVDDNMMAGMIARLARRDALQAASWGPGQIDKMKPGATRVIAMLSLGLGTLGVDPDLSKQMLDKAGAEVKPNDFSSESARGYALLAALSSRLESPDADHWLQAMQLAIERSIPAKQQPDRVPVLAATLAEGSAALVEAAIAPFSPDIQIAALRQAIPVLARRDLPAARRLLDAMEGLLKAPVLNQNEQNDNGYYRPSPRDSWESAADDVAKALAATDPKASLALLRRMKGQNTDKAINMALAASHLTGAEQEAAFREAMDTAQERYQPVTTMSRIAALTSQANAALGEEFFGQARERLGRKSRFNDEMREGVGGYAFYRAAKAPEAARLLLENEWTRRLAEQARRKSKSPNDDYQVIYQLKPLVQAMAVLDWNRAFEMMQQAQDAGLKKEQWSDLRPLLLQLAVQPEARRGTMSFEQYLRDDEDF